MSHIDATEAQVERHRMQDREHEITCRCWPCMVADYSPGDGT